MFFDGSAICSYECVVRVIQLTICTIYCVPPQCFPIASPFAAIDYNFVLDKRLSYVVPVDDYDITNCAFLIFFDTLATSLHNCVVCIM